MKPKKIVGVAMAATLLVGGCSAGGQNSAGTDAPKNEVSKVSLDKDGSQSKGPAKEVPGSRKGGTITALWRQDQVHYDPGQMQTSPDQTISELISRRLTMYKIDGDKTILVGDLATNTGESTDGGKTWKFTLKDGVKHSDGTPIVAADFKWAVERSFYEKYNRGFPYIQSWLVDSDEFSKVYNGPYEGKELGNDKIEVPDDKTIIFKLPKAHPDFPFAAALGTTVPVQKAKDSKDGLDQNPPTSGPYKIESHVVDKSLKLVKNEFWDPNSDPIRHQFVDGFTINFGPLPPEITDRLTASAGDDKNATALYHSVPPERIDQVMNDPKTKAQVLDVATSASEVYSINTTRIPDVNVRKALLTAFPKEQARQTNGGPFYGDLSTTLGSPANLGWKKYDLPGITDVNPKGDPEKAKKMLTDAGKLGQSISFGYSQQPNREKEALAIADGLEKAGFKVEKIPMQPKTFNDARDTVNNNLDLYWSSWAADWPTGVTVYPEIYDGRKIGDGRPNNSHFNDPEINSEIDRILAIDDPIKQGDEFAKLDSKIMEKVPAIPYAYTRRLIMSGTNVGGASVDTHGVLNFANLFLKS